MLFRSQVANGFIGIEEHIFVPTVSDALDSDAAPLESDDFIIHAAKLATRSERNERPRFSGSCFKLLQDLKIWIFGVQNGMATLANDGFGVTQCAKNDRRAALRATGWTEQPANSECRLQGASTTGAGESKE